MKALPRIILFTLILLGATLSQAQSNFHNIHYLDPYNPEYKKGEVLVKFKDEVKVESALKTGIAKTGITSVDVMLEPYQIESIDKVFKETRKQRQKKTIRTIRDYKGQEIEVPALFNIYKLKFDTIWDAKQIIEVLQKDKNIEFAEPNYMVYTNEVIENGKIPDSPPRSTSFPSQTGNRDTYPDDPLYTDGSQWYLDAINAPAAWDSATGVGQVIGIIDTGVDWDHPDLDDNIWENEDEIPDNGIDDDANGYIDDVRGWDYINNDNDPNDDNSHGTHVAGIAAAEGNNGIGMCGVAWNAKILPIKVLQSSGTGNSSDFAAGIEYASNNGATVINMSLGSYGESQVVKTALENAYAGSGSGGGRLLVAAAGNDSRNLLGEEGIPDGNLFPACYPFVLGVMAMDGTNLAAFSNIDPSGPIEFTNQWGYNYELRSYGVGIMSCKPNGGYWVKNGTSMAAPEVSGAIALMRQYDPVQSGEEVLAKIIQGANANVLDIYAALTTVLTPDLYYVNHTLIDTIAGSDNDGAADAGETIEIWLSVKNAGGFADSVYANLSLGEFEDTLVATIDKNNQYIGNISAYASLTGEADPWKITISPDAGNDRDIVFDYTIGCANDTNTTTGSFTLKVQNGEELLGIMDTTLTLTADKLWVINGSFKVGANGTLNLDPGVKLVLNNILNLVGTLNSNGTKDSLVYIYGPRGIYANPYGTSVLSANYTVFSSFTDDGWTYYYAFMGLDNGLFQNCYFENNSCDYLFYIGNTLTFNHCIFRDSYFKAIFNSLPPRIIVNFSNFYNLGFYTYDGIGSGGSLHEFNYCNFSKIPYWVFGSSVSFTFNGTLNKSNFLISENTVAIYGKKNIGDFQYYQDIYWGSISQSIIDKKVYDFFDDATLPQIVYDPYLNQPSDSAHGCVWKVEVNEVDPQDEQLDPIGTEEVQFDVYFNKPMDIDFIPMLTFGVAEPYTQNIVVNNNSWSADSSIWTAYYNIDPTTGDGINQIRVIDAIDTAGFEIPIEVERFQFIIQAASAASVEFYALAGIGKVDLEWPPTPSEDALGYNLYRSYNITDSTYSDTLMINTELILDTVYTDYNVIPDTTYHYMYKTLGTDMQETDYSKVATAIPFNAANGDANGDLSVNVLDITTIVAYMLNQNPSPFLFDAADVNYDGQINVLDIIGLVQLINGSKSIDRIPRPKFSNELAYYSIDDNMLQIESKGNIAALQLKLKLKNGELKILEDLRIFSLQNGFEFAYSVIDDEIIGILFSLDAKQIPDNDQSLFRFEGIEITNFEISEIFGGDLNGDYVPVLKKGQQPDNNISEDFILSVQPNPFTQSTVISWQLAEDAMVDISIYNLKGIKIKQIKKEYQSVGIYQQTWNAIDNNGEKVTPGVYICHVEAQIENKKTTKDVKIIFMR